MEINNNRYGGKERRRYARLPGTIVEFFPIGETEKKKSSFTENVSPVGICFLSDEKIKEETLLSLKIQLPDDEEPIETKGRVVWVSVSSFLTVEKANHYDIGVEITEINELDREKIIQYIEKHIDEL